MSFHCNWKLAIFVVICLPIVVSAGFWQLDREEQKHQRQLQITALKNKPPLNLKMLSPEQHRNFQNVSVTGKFSDKVFFIDNQIYRGQFGYEVIQPLWIAIDEMLLVSRGWVRGELDRRFLPSIDVPDEPIELQGYLYKPSENIRLADYVAEEGWPKRMQTSDVQVLSNELDNHQLVRMHYLLRLKRDSKAALDSHWTLVSTSPEKHRAYAIQWFSMAVLLLVLFMYVSLTKTDNK